MKLKYISLLASALFSFFFILSCKDDDSNNYVNATLSADAQVYSFSIKGTPMSKIDSVNYPIMDATPFVIDQLSSLIYNADSFPYQTRLAKFALTATFSTNSPSKIQLLYPDTIINWNSTDSIDFSKKFYLKVTAQNGTATKQYNIDLRVHQIDPDTMVWVKAGSLPNNIGNLKALQRQDRRFFCFSKNNASIEIYVSDANGVNWSTQKANGLPPTTIIESICLFKDTFFAVDSEQKAYSSVDGINWTRSGGTAFSILGILPGKSEDKDSLLVIQKYKDTYLLAKTLDLKQFNTTKIKGSNQDDIYKTFPAFPVSGFSALSRFDRKNPNSNILIISGGKGYDGNQKNTTWLVKEGDGSVEIVFTQQHDIYKPQQGISNFLYDDQLYALAQDNLYVSQWGNNWKKAPKKQVIDPQMAKVKSQSIVVDKNNNIWVFGGISGSNFIKDIWKGRLNRLSK